jgi:hypothetical protein
MNKNNLPKSWCVQNDGSQRFKNTVIKYLNIISDYGGNSKRFCGDKRYFYGVTIEGFCDASNTSAIFGQILTINEFDYLLNLKDEFVRGEEVEVSISGNTWNRRIYLETIEGAKVPYICVDHYEIDKFRKGEPFSFVRWEHIRKIKKEPKLEISVKKDGLDVNPSNVEIKDGKIIITL